MAQQATSLSMPAKNPTQRKSIFPYIIIELSMI